MEITIVTGLSGAGKSRVVDALEDIGYFCVDNMPPKLMPTFAQLLLNSREKREKVAIVTDIRVGASFSDLFLLRRRARFELCQLRLRPFRAMPVQR